MGLASREAREQFRFDPDRHEYTDYRGVALPHITGMLEATGWIDSTWYTEESSLRGRAVHSLTADYDLGALDPEKCVSRYRPWLLSHVKGMSILKPSWDAVEAPAVHPDYRFGGRPDRVGKVYGVWTVYEIKTNGKGWNLEKAHPIQLALQAILLAASRPLPAEHWNRMAGYYRPDGKFRVEQYKKREDFDIAYDIIARCCR